MPKPPTGMAPPPGTADEAPIYSAQEYAALLVEVKMLAAQIEFTRREIASLTVDGVSSSPVAAATDELDAVITHTAEATETILDVCESLEIASLGDNRELIGAATARIYEACSFQDITGQRVTKVVRTLQAIETKIAEILEVFGDGDAGQPQRAAEPCASAQLLNGPQQPGMAMDQCAVDAILNGGQ